MIESEGKKSLRKSWRSIISTDFGKLFISIISVYVLFLLSYYVVGVFGFFPLVTVLIPFLKGTTLFKSENEKDKFLEGSKITLVDSFIPLSKKWEM